MKILHTSDWHLGQRLLQNDRQEEFAMAFDWLLQTIEQEQVDVLLVAGDIFDIGNPPNQARKLYYNFLSQLMQSSCKHIIITSGNHDSPAMLNAPKALLQAFNIHVVGAYTGSLEDELIVIENEQGVAELVVAAVPFLRDRDLRVSVAGESLDQRNERLQAGLAAHYEALAELCKPYKEQGALAIAMGHMYAKGAVAADKQDNIYLGNRENMDAGQFPALFDYVALGHIHRAQKVEQQEHIRYSGSMIPLSFSERADNKVVLLLETEGQNIQSIQSIAIPVFRRLKSIEGDLEKVQKDLERFVSSKERLLTPWVEVLVHTQEYIAQLDKLLSDFTDKMPIELVKIRVQKNYQALKVPTTSLPDLEDLAVDDVFKKRCESQGDIQPEQLDTLMTSFRELKEWMKEKQDSE